MMVAIRMFHQILLMLKHTESRKKIINTKDRIMPYIKLDSRIEILPEIDALVDSIKELTKGDLISTDGILNYTITKMLIELYPDARYHDYNEIIGMLECCKLEFYRKMAAPYEDLKEIENGSVQ